MLTISKVARLKLEQIKEVATPGDRSDFIDSWYKTGGKLFVESVKSYGANERGEALVFTCWYEEYLELVGDIRIQETFASGASQLGKSLAHTLLLCYCLTDGRFNTLWGYDQERSLNAQVPSNFKPVITSWLQKKGIKRQSSDSKSNTLYQVAGATAQFLYTSTSKVKQSGMAAAGGIAVGVSRDILFVEERSQHTPGSVDPLRRRLDAGRLPSRPVREIGTPGGGKGIEAQIASARYHFYPHYVCQSCGGTYPLHPKGCLLKTVKRHLPTGEVVSTYLSDSGRPLDWHHSDPNNAVKTAYFGCMNCGERISDGDRRGAWFQCLKTGIRLRNFLDSLPDGVPKEVRSVGIVLSPLLRVEETNTAAAIIKEGLNTYNPDDWQQQSLGEASIAKGGSITQAMIERAIGMEAPDRKPDFILAGLDQGRGEDWLMIASFWCPDDWKKLPPAQVLETSVRQVLYGSSINRDEIPVVLRNFGVTYGVTDSEPDIPDAARLCAATCLTMVDQKSGTPYVAKEGAIESGGSKFPCWMIRQEDFLSAVSNGFTLTAWDGKLLYRLPEGWRKWIAMANDERSPIRHLTSISRDSETRRWVRPDDKIDDLYFASMFMEAAFFLQLTQDGLKPKKYSVGGSVEGFGDRLSW